MVKDKPAKPAKHAGGRPTKYRSKYARELITFMEQDPWDDVVITHTNKKGETWSTTERRANRLRFLTQFARKIDVSRETLLEWSTCGKHPEFTLAYARAREFQTEHLLDNGLAGLFDGAMTKFAAVNMTDLRDKNETAVSGDINIVIEQH